MPSGAEWAVMATYVWVALAIVGLWCLVRALRRRRAGATRARSTERDATSAATSPD